MNCKEAIEYIHSLERFGIKPGLERISELCRCLGNPQDKLKFIHIAGTNGKGSTSTMTANMLIASGYNTGLYTSPYVIDFRERIQFNGEMISQEELAHCVETVKNAAEENNIQVTEFEMVTAVAFLYYSLKKCDYVVLEVGLGGRFDATNVISVPEVAAIVCISLDHTAVLGNTITEIAGEKCGIIKQNCKVVSYPLQTKDALDVIENKCRAVNASLSVPDLDCLTVGRSGIKGTEVSYKGIDFTLPLAGEHMVYNAVTAVEIIKSLDIGVTDMEIADGISHTVMAARMEVISENPLIILDGGHNEDCAKALKKYVETYLQGRRIVMLTSIMADKDFDTYLKLIVPLAHRFIATKADVPRALGSAELLKAASEYCNDCVEVAEPLYAVEEAYKSAEKNDVIVICGSFYLAGEIRNKLINDWRKDND